MEFIDKLNNLLKSGEEVEAGISAFETEPKFAPGDIVFKKDNKTKYEKEIKQAEKDGNRELVIDLKKKCKTYSYIVKASRFYFDEDEKPKWKYMVEPEFMDVGTNANTLWFEEDDIVEADFL